MSDQVVQGAVVDKRKPVTFFRVLWAYIYNSLEAYLYAFVPVMFAFLVLFLKPNLLPQNAVDAMINNLTNHPPVAIFFLVCQVIATLIFVLLFARDLGRRFMVNEQTTGKIFGYVTILVILFLLGNFSLIGLVDAAITLGLLHWTLKTRTSQDLLPPGYNLLRGKNRTILLFSIFLVGALVLYFGT